MTQNNDSDLMAQTKDSDFMSQNFITQTYDSGLWLIICNQTNTE